MAAAAAASVEDHYKQARCDADAAQTTATTSTEAVMAAFWWVDDRPYLPLASVPPFAVATTTTTTGAAANETTANRKVDTATDPPSSTDDAAVADTSITTIVCEIMALLVVREQQQQQNEQGVAAGGNDHNQFESGTSTDNDNTDARMTVVRVSGGITNTLYRVENWYSHCLGRASAIAAEAAASLTPMMMLQPGSSSSTIIRRGYSSSVLVRVFGAEGMIDRDVENGHYAALARAGIAPPYYGRFGNGRIEGWMDNMRPLETHELPMVATEVATQLANLHFRFHPTRASTSSSSSEPAAASATQERSNYSGSSSSSNLDWESISLWKQLYDWLEQAERASMATADEMDACRGLDLSSKIRPELDWLKETILATITSEKRAKDDVDDLNVQYPALAFCHNDLLAANILYRDDSNNDDDDEGGRVNMKTKATKKKIQLIDFEYGGINYRAFDIANHFNEYAGGPPTHPTPDYALFPSHKQQCDFVRAYLLEAARSTTTVVTTTTAATGRHDTVPVVTDSAVEWFVDEIRYFVLANHLYWGLWAVNQAATEGCTEFNYMLYAVNRIQEYWTVKKKKHATHEAETFREPK
jgi:thiamine kinase-like enzyme